MNYECSDVPSLLKKIGYTDDDIALFKKIAREERKIYTSEILDTDFFYL